jgi:acetyl/propionyl-CoA carboxylase alpha subunit
VCAFPVAQDKWQVRVGAWVLPVRRVIRAAGDKPRRSPKLFALINGRVHSILYREGAVVPAHEPLLVLDALGMLVPHSLPVEVRVRKWNTAAESLVQAGEELAEFEIIS